jgi:hypothetical protein
MLGGEVSVAYQGICATLAGWTCRGGYVLIGEGYWIQPPAPGILRIWKRAMTSSAIIAATFRPVSTPG